MADKRPIKLLVAGYIMDRISFRDFAKEIDVTPILPTQILNTPLTGGDTMRLFDEYIRPTADAAYVIVLGDKSDGFLFLEITLRDFFFRRDIRPKKNEDLIEPGWTIDMKMGMVRRLNNPESPQT